MCLKKCKGLLRASLCLAIGYLEGSSNVPKCREVVSSYLNNNGLKFDFTKSNNVQVVNTIVNVAEDVVEVNTPIDVALEVLSVALGIDINY